MAETHKHIFLEALLLAVFLFSLGLMLGFFVESSRINNIADQYLNSEVNVLDAQIQNELIKENNLNCELVIEKNIEFGNKIYEDAKLLEKYEESNKLTNGLGEQQRRYSILRTLFWLNSIEIADKCRNSFHTVVYLYDYKTTDLVLEAEQKFYSQYLLDLKQEYGDKMMLIPIAKNLGISSLDLLLSKYKLNTTSIIVDEELVVDSVEDMKKIKEALDNNKK